MAAFDATALAHAIDKLYRPDSNGNFATRTMTFKNCPDGNGSFETRTVTLEIRPDDNGNSTVHEVPTADEKVNETELVQPK